MPSITNPIVGRLFKQLRDRHPGIQLKILEGSSGQVEEWLADARVDIAILYRYGTALHEQEQALATVDSYLIGAAGDRLTAKPEIPFSSLHELPFILPSAPNGLRTALDAMARQEHITLAPVLEADSLPLMRSTVAEALAVTNAKRIPVLKDVPTIGELGFPKAEAYNWYGISRRPALRPRSSTSCTPPSVLHCVRRN
nr:LysR substrate-binding domain-containing protein [Variovorax sp. dw_308]